MSSLQGHRHLLQQSLTQYAPADALEAAHRAEMLELLGTTDNPLARDHYNPGHFTASAFVLSPNGTELALIFHGKLRRWLQPGGHLETGDTSPVHGALREAREETGLTDLVAIGDKPFDLDVHEIPQWRQEPAHRHFDLRYLFQSRSTTLSPNSEVTSAKWVHRTEIGSLASDASVLRAVEKLSAQKR